MEQKILDADKRKDFLEGGLSVGFPESQVHFLWNFISKQVHCTTCGFGDVLYQDAHKDTDILNTFCPECASKTIEYK